MKTACLHLSRYLKTVLILGMSILSFTLPTAKADGSRPHWQEAEQFKAVSLEPDRALTSKPPASGGLSTSGAIFSHPGGWLEYHLSLAHPVPQAMILLRVARLHFRESMPPMELQVEVDQDGRSVKTSVQIGNTGGWGTLDAGEWGFVEGALGIDLDPGSVSVRLSATEGNSNVNIDGFFIAPAGFMMTHGEIAALQRIHLSGDGYFGLRIPGDTVFPGAFDGFEVVGRAFHPMTTKVEVSLLEKGKDQSSVLTSTSLELDDKPGQLAFKESILEAVPDGAYELKVTFGHSGQSLVHPVSILRDLVVRARLEARRFLELAREFKASDSPLKKRLIPDLVHAAEYMENAIRVLEARQKGEGVTSELAAALAYFERSPSRTAQGFAHDIESLIAQTNLSLEWMDQGVDPYAGRSGDLRRAFYSKATGVLEPYRLFIPAAMESMPSIPLLIMLHGGGGDENYFPDLEGGTVLQVLEERPYLMVSPRSTSWYTGPGVDDLVQLVEDMVHQYPRIDRSRIYSTGVSRGGYGTFNLALEHPKLLRAISCVSSGPPITGAVSRIEQLPVLMLHGADDVVVPVERAQRSAEALEKRGHTVKLVVFPGHGHEYHGKEYLNLTLDFFEEHLETDRRGFP